jgi:glucose-6-phosphate isomerase
MNSLLQQFALKAKSRTINDLFIDNNRADKFSLTAAGLYLDFAKQNVSEGELTLLIDWAKELKLEHKIQSMFNGDLINNTENRAVLHTLLRAPESRQRAILAEQADEVIATERRMAAIVDNIHTGKMKGATNKRFTDVLAIGIGGSFYGCKTALNALHHYYIQGIKVHLLSNIDSDAISEKLAFINAETTLVVIISKTFTTQETILNANSVKQWLIASGINKTVLGKHLLAVTSHGDKALEFGVNAENILPMWNWVGGRFSVWSAVGLPLALAIGMEHFNDFKQGAWQMDEHFQKADFSVNMPIIMALIGIWNRNFLAYPALAILPYSHALRAFPGYLQQTDMESNGKSVTQQGEKLKVSTAPIVFGQEGTNGQHAFMQLMHQSDNIIPADFIIALSTSSSYQEHQQVLFANCLAQAEALMQGKSLKQVTTELLNEGMTEQDALRLAPHKTMKGNTPSNVLLLQQLDPKSLGALFALYEHKIFVQGALWQINSFDQWGVELGKQLSGDVLTSLKNKTIISSISSLSPSTKKLIHQFINFTSFNKN